MEKVRVRLTKDVVLANKINSIYYAAPGRHYRRSQLEIQENCVSCPKCNTKMLRIRLDKPKDKRFKFAYLCNDCNFLIPEDKVVDSLEDVRKIKERLNRV